MCGTRWQHQQGIFRVYQQSRSRWLRAKIGRRILRSSQGSAVREKFGVAVLRCCGIIFDTEQARNYHRALQHNPCTLADCNYEAATLNKLNHHISIHPKKDGRKAMKFLYLKSVEHLCPSCIEEEKARKWRNYRDRVERKKRENDLLE